MRRVAFLTGNLIKSATRLATDVEPWAERIDCHVADFLRAGGRGDALKVPIPKPMIGNVHSLSRFTHPLTPGRLDEMAAEMKASTHFVLIVPGYDLPEGQISRDV